MDMKELEKRLTNLELAREQDRELHASLTRFVTELADKMAPLQPEGRPLPTCDQLIAELNTKFVDLLKRYEFTDERVRNLWDMLVKPSPHIPQCQNANDLPLVSHRKMPEPLDADGVPIHG